MLGSGDGRVVPTNQSARGDRHGSHRGSALGSNSQGLHEPAWRFEPLLPHEPRWVEEQVQRPQGHRQRRQEPPCPPDQEPRAMEDQSRESGRSRLPRDQRSTTESTEIHGKEETVATLPGGWRSVHTIRLEIEPFAELVAHSKSLTGSQVDFPDSCRAKPKSAPVTVLQSRKENPNQLPLSVSFCVFRGYPFVMIFLAGVILISLARSWGRASGVSRSGPDSVRPAPSEKGS